MNTYFETFNHPAMFSSSKDITFGILDLNSFIRRLSRGPHATLKKKGEDDENVKKREH